MRPILAIDPGPRRSAWLVLDGHDVLVAAIEPNDHVLDAIAQRDGLAEAVVEDIEPWGGAVGPDALATMFWVGRFVQALHGDATLLRRSRVLPAIGVPRLPRGRAQAAARAVLLDAWGGGNPVRRDHPLHGVRGDVWSALALAVAYRDGLR